MIRGIDFGKEQILVRYITSVLLVGRKEWRPSGENELQ